MSETTSIAWCDHTFNPWRGCTRVAPECASCYAENLSRRNQAVLGSWGPNGTRVVAAERYWQGPEKWDKKAQASGERRRVFCASLADVFEDWNGPMTGVDGRVRQRASSTRGEKNVRNETMNDVRQRLFSLIDATTNLDWLLLTKRPKNIRRLWIGEQGDGFVDIVSLLPGEYPRHMPKYRRNLWLGTSCGHPDSTQRVASLLECRDLAPVLFVSCEPMLGRVEFRPWLDPNCDIDPDDADDAADLDMNGPRETIDQLIIGVESNGPRLGSLGDFASESDWRDYAVDLVRQCREAGVAAFVKQIPLNGKLSHDPSEWPEPLSVQEFPTANI